MRRLSVGFVLIILAGVLAACGDMGNHFGEFRQQPPPPTVAQKITANMPIIPGKAAHASLPIYIAAYNGGIAVPIGTALANPLIVNTNYKGYVQFSSPTGPTGQKYNHLSLQAVPPSIEVYYTKPAGVNPCSGSEPPAVVTVFNHDANPQYVTVDLNGCSTGPSPSPTPSTKPTKSPKPTPSPSTKPSSSPTPTPQPIVKRLSLSMPATPNPVSPGTFPLIVTAFGPNGKAIPTGTTLVNPIQLTSNSSCSISFSFGNQTATSLTIPTAPGSVNVVYAPPTASCTPPNTIIITALDIDATPQTAQFSILGGTATVASLTFSMLSNPNIGSEGVYPFFITAKDASGATIPAGEALTNPILLSSNAACATGFGVTTNPGTFTGTFRITNTQTQVYIAFAPPGSPQNTCAGPPVGGNVIVTGIAAGGVSQTYSFPY
ncbi:MAG: hypothetical protein JO029_10720 [Candidatus Eremiobacteraeota bacterium]|nr:hypothetical protein [Candidatus Eremiobacteraeota bacterium]